MAHGFTTGASGVDPTAIHTDGTAEVSGLTTATLAATDVFMLEDADASFGKKKVAASALATYVFGAKNISDVSDVTITTIAAGELLKWSGSAWINNTLAEAGIASTSHASTHADGGSDELSGNLAANARVAVSKNSGATVGTRRTINFIEGTNVTLTIADDAAGEEVDVTITSTAGGGSPLTTKGDIYVYSTADTRLGIGTTGHALFANATPAEGMEWRAIVEADISNLTHTDTTAIHDNVAGEINAVAAISPSMTSTDIFLVEDASDTYNKKKVTGLQMATLVQGLTDVGELANVTITSIATGELLKWNGSAWINNTLAEAGIVNTAFFYYAIEGTFALGTGTLRIPMTVACTIQNVRFACNTAPTGATAIVDVNKNGTTIFTTQGNRPTIAISGTDSGNKVPDVTALAAGDYLTIDVDQIGSTVAGADGVVIIEVEV